MHLATSEATRLADRLPSGLRFPVIEGVIAGAQPGDVFVDDSSAPRMALVVTRFGFMSLLGSSDNDEASDDVARTLREHPRLRNRYLLWYNPAPEVLHRLESRGSNRGRTRERISYAFDARSLEHADNYRPTDVRVEPVDRGNLADCGVFDFDLDSRFWRSSEDFIDHALGVVVRVGGSVASLCYSAGIGDDRAEIDVATLDEHRGKGLARLACCSFIGRCLDAGLAPSWDCFAGNEPSMRLARTLGFIERARYPFHTFNT